jgi:hypothetical protein
VANQVVPPVAQVGTEKVGAGPVPHGLAVLNMVADHLSTCSDTVKMAVGTQGEDTITGGATIALQIKAGRETTEVALGVAVPPETIMPAAGTLTWPHPGIFFARSKNLLEQSGNKIYHEVTLVVGGNTPGGNWAGSSAKLSARSILKTEKASCEGQIIRQSPLSCQSILMIFNSK